GSGIGSILSRPAWSAAGVATATPLWRGFTSSALSTVILGVWAEAVGPNPAQRGSVARTRVVIRLVVLPCVLPATAADGPRPARAARNNGHNRFRQTRRTGLILERKKVGERSRKRLPRIFLNCLY